VISLIHGKIIVTMQIHRVVSSLLPSSACIVIHKRSHLYLCLAAANKLTVCFMKKNQDKVKVSAKGSGQHVLSKS
jgi:hypothetical protein